MKEKNTFDDLMASAKNFVEKQKGVWDHTHWENFLKDMQKKGLALTEETSQAIGGLLESLKKIYSMHPEESQKFRDITSHAKAFVEKYKGLWDHEKWESLLRDIQNKGISMTEANAQAIGSILESIKKFYGIAPKTKQEEAQPTQAQAAQPYEEEKEALVKKLEDELKVWDAKIDILEANAEKIKKEHKVLYKKDLDEVLSLWKEAKMMIQKIKKSDEKQWKELKDGADEIWINLEGAVEKALSFEP